MINQLTFLYFSFSFIETSFGVEGSLISTVVLEVQENNMSTKDGANGWKENKYFHRHLKAKQKLARSFAC